MSVLETIRGELQHIVDAMRAVTGVDITIVDNQLVRIVGTGPLADEIGQPAPDGSAFSRCLRLGKQYFIGSPKKDPLCADCANRSCCRELAELCIPIKSGKKTIGVLGMCAFDKDAQQQFLTNQENYMRFESQLSVLIASMLGERQFSFLAEYRSLELSTVINALNEGLIILSAEGEIATVNRYLADRLSLSPDCAPTLRALLPKIAYEQLVAQHFAGDIGPVRLKNAQYLISASPIRIKKERRGTVLVFSDFGKMQESVLKATRSHDIVTFDDIVGESDTLLAARQQAIQVAEQDASVLLCGETGTGKEIFARAIHSASRRKDDLFMPINCGAIPESLIESELFGYEKGAFTGATASGKLGLFELCKDGTLFLDEVAELPPSTQVKLLRALEEKEIIRVGGTVPLHVNPRVISASHQDLSAMVRNGTFREDLYYRLNVVPIVIPPLRDRGYDVIILAHHFLSKFAAAYAKNITGFTEDCEQALLRHPFPGNIRELRNLIEYATIFETSDVIRAETLSSKISVHTAQPQTLLMLTAAYERSIINRMLCSTDHSLDAKREIAEELGISLTTLYRKLGNR